MQNLSSDFLIELIKSCILSKDMIEVIKPHMQYSFLSTQEYKQIFKYIFDYHTNNNKAPTIGILSQHLESPDEQSILSKVRECNIYDSKNQILDSFEKFVKKNKFALLHKKTADLFNSGKHEEAMKLLEKESKEINSISLKSKALSRIFADFDKRQDERRERDYSQLKIPTGVPAFDYHTRGGPEKGTAMLEVARSGVGKSTSLRSKGFNAAFRGFNVLHFQAEGTKKEVEDAYDAMWTGVEVYDIKEGRLTGVDVQKIQNARKAFLSQCGEIYVYAFEQFHQSSIADCRNILIELLKTTTIDVVIFDYLEKFDPGDKKKYGTNNDGVMARKLAVAEKIVNISTEFNVVCHTATQASNIEKEEWNNPLFVITRENISNLKATIDAFAYCTTLNQTESENDNDIIRIHEEKLRHYKIKSYESTYKIVQDRSCGRFINISETKKRFWDDVNKKVIRDMPVEEKKVKSSIKKITKEED